MGGISLKLSPLVDVTTSAFVWKPGISTLTRDDGGLLPDAYLHVVRKQLISERIKGPLVAAFRSPLTKAVDRNVETLGL